MSGAGGKESLPELQSVVWIDPGTPSAGLAWYESEDLGAGMGSGLHASEAIGTWVRLDSGEQVDSYRNDPANGPEFSKSYDKEEHAKPARNFQSKRLRLEMSDGEVLPHQKRQGEWSWTSKNSKSDSWHTIRASVEEQGKSRVVKVIDVHGKTGSVRTYWSPDGKYIGIYTKGSFSADMHVAATHGPTVELVANKGLSEKSIALATEALRKGGFNLIKSYTYSKKDRDKSVVFVKGSNSADAKRLTILLPGGAGQEELTWDSAADFVVALGKSGEAEAKSK